MSTERDSHAGPQMVVATPVMKRGPVRISRIGSDITLPRPIRAVALVAMIIGGLVGALVGLVVGGVSSTIYGAGIFMALSYVIVTFSPLQGESFLKWMELTWGARRRANFTIDGLQARVSVGICPVPNPARDEAVTIAPGAVRIPPSQYDHRGVRISERNRNVDEAVSTPTLETLPTMAFPFDGHNPDPWGTASARPVRPWENDPQASGSQPSPRPARHPYPGTAAGSAAPDAEYGNPDPWA
jgi:uncharacterized membrane protein YuzA (DUF378 family)